VYLYKINVKAEINTEPIKISAYLSNFILFFDHFLKSILERITVIVVINTSKRISGFLSSGNIIKEDRAMTIGSELFMGCNALKSLLFILT
jgi:hypothetical protein